MNISNTINRLQTLWKGWVSFAPKLILALLALGLLTFFIQLSQSTSNAATNGVDISYTAHTNDQGSTAQAGVKVVNNSGSDKKIQFKRETYWCTGVGGGDSESKVKCFDHGNASWDGEFTLANGDSKETGTLSQQIGGNGSCGSAQVDIYVKVDGQVAGPYWGVAFKEPCNVPSPKVVCDSLTLDKTGGLGVKATLSGHGTDGGKIVNYKFNFGDGTNTTQSGNSLNHTFAVAGTYTVTGSVVGDNGQNDSGAGCQKTVTFQTSTYYACQDQACVAKTCPVGQTCPTTCNHNDVTACKTTTNYFTCVNQACVQQTCPAGQTCSTTCNPNDTAACKNTTTYYACQDQACVAKTCPAGQTCPTTCDHTDSAACKNTTTYYTCQDQACVAKTCPAGQSCSTTCDHTDSDACKQSYFACDNLTCKKFFGIGTSTCANNDQCTARTHFECVDNSCKEVAGGGSSDCSNNDQCKPVVNQNTFCDWLFVDPQTGNAPLNVKAQVSGHTENGGSIVNFKFNFGDGTGDRMQSGDTLNYTYTQNGTYVINGYVLDNRGNVVGGAGSCQKVVQVTTPGVTPPPPSGKGKVPSTGAETAVLPILSALGSLGWVLKKFKSKLS